MDLEEVVHPQIAAHSMDHFRSGHYRESVLNSILVLYDYIRARTGLDLDGPDLIGRAFSEKQPYLRVADLDTASGRNKQVGFMQMAKGLYQGVRSPNAHSGTNEIDRVQAARYLAAASALIQIVCDSEPGNVLRTDGVYATETKENSATFLRFFDTGKGFKAVSASISTPSDREWVPDWLTLDWGKQYDCCPGAVTISGNDIEFVVTIHGGKELKYSGHINGLTLVLSMFSAATNRGYQTNYRFRPMRR